MIRDDSILSLAQVRGELKARSRRFGKGIFKIFNYQDGYEEFLGNVDREPIPKLGHLRFDEAPDQRILPGPAIDVSLAYLVRAGEGIDFRYRLIFKPEKRAVLGNSFARKEKINANRYLDGSLNGVNSYSLKESAVFILYKALVREILGRRTSKKDHTRVTYSKPDSDHILVIQFDHDKREIHISIEDYFRGIGNAGCSDSYDASITCPLPIPYR